MLQEREMLSSCSKNERRGKLPGTQILRCLTAIRCAAFVTCFVLLVPRLSQALTSSSKQEELGLEAVRLHRSPPWHSAGVVQGNCWAILHSCGLREEREGFTCPRSLVKLCCLGRARLWLPVTSEPSLATAESALVFSVANSKICSGKKL